MNRHPVTLFDLLPIGLAIGLAIYLLLRKNNAGPNGKTIVRCREGHLFTTIWVPGISFKSIRLGMVRFQHCPVGDHWTFVTPVRVSDLSDEEIRIASHYQDTDLP